jgi:hypothetical protein
METRVEGKVEVYFDDPRLFENYKEQCSAFNESWKRITPEEICRDLDKCLSWIWRFKYKSKPPSYESLIRKKRDYEKRKLRTLRNLNLL